jgi:acyl-coenzyme A synthetase/AMP-(fatty) acid ligase
MIKTSGYRVSPMEIEEAAYDTGQARDSDALGVEDSKLGQHVVVVVRSTSGAVDVGSLLAQIRQALPPACCHSASSSGWRPLVHPTASSTVPFCARS